MHRLLIPTLVTVAALAAPGAGAPAARADAPAQGIAMYALVVGSNAAGPGQQTLKYSEDDAHRVAATLRELGGYAADAVDVLVRPTPDELRDRLARLSTRVAMDRAAGRQARVMFYYSGHARSTAIDLGAEQLALGELRQRLFAIPATLTVVVLDACQSGAFSRVKGAQPAADFSFNSRQRLDASGIVVLASSSGSELSQESEQLRSSYFTHHLLVGLRGAGDTDGDGQVSIDEAYRYAYHQTLLATAETAVGGQHVSLEVDLKGHGEVPLSFPRAASAAIELPAAVEGQAIVEDRRSRTVVAETYKARGAPVRIAVAPGEYRVLVRHAGRLARCEVSTGGAPRPAAPPHGGAVASTGGAPRPAAPPHGGAVASTGGAPRPAAPPHGGAVASTVGGIGVVDLARCPSEAIVTAASKGLAGPPLRPLMFEVAGLIGDERDDAFTETLGAFGYTRASGAALGMAIHVLRRLDRRLALGGFTAIAASPEWSQPTERQSQRFAWSTATLGVLARGVQPFSLGRRGPHPELYAQVGLGFGVGRTEFTDADARRTEDRFVGWALSLGGGLRVEGNRGIGFGFGYQFDHAPVIENLTGDTHASGGHRLTASVSYAR